MWNLFTISSLQFCDDSAIASLEANQSIITEKCSVSSIFPVKLSLKVTSATKQ